MDHFRGCRCDLIYVLNVLCCLNVFFLVALITLTMITPDHDAGSRSAIPSIWYTQYKEIMNHDNFSGWHPLENSLQWIPLKKNIFEFEWFPPSCFFIDVPGILVW